MKNIVLLCSQGASTSILVKAMKKAAEEEGYLCTIQAFSINELNNVKNSADVILLGPQIRYQEKKVKESAACPVSSIDMRMYGMMDGKGVLQFAKEVMG